MALAYGGFIVLVLVLVALDLGVFHGRSHRPSMREAIGFSALWIAVGLSFAGFIYFAYEHHLLGLGVDVPQLSHHAARDVGGLEAASLYLTGYGLEKALALDNLFVILFIFRALRIDEKYQHRVLFWGILGALVMRGVMIGIGAVVIQRFEWVLYVFGAILIVSGLKLLRPKKGGEDEKEELPFLVRWLQKRIPIAEVDAPALVVRTKSGWGLTTSAVALVSIESADVVFAVDSVPAIFAITLDPFLVFTSNVLAVLGLRSLYFVLALAADQLVYLGQALAAILVFVGGKMIALYWDLHLPPLLSLSIIVGLLLTGVGASLLARRRQPSPERASED